MPAPFPQEAADTPPPPCSWGTIVNAQAASVTRAQPGLEPGILFSTGGSFAEKPVDEACDPGPELGPFPVGAGGTLVARLTGNPPAPNQWSLNNYGTGLRIVFEPKLGEGDYGPGQEILSFYIPQDETEAEMGATWPSAGRLHAYIGAPWGNGPLTSSCFEQAFSAEVEIVEANDTAPALSGMTLNDGDRIVTEQLWGQALIAGSNNWIGPDSEVVFENNVAGGSDTLELPVPDWITKLPAKAEKLAQAGLPMPDAYYADPAAFMAAFDDDVLREAYDLIGDQQDPCEAAVTLKLFLESRQHIGTQKLARGYDWAADTLSIWLLPNEWSALEAIVPVPGLGKVANLKNFKDTVERVMTEIAVYQDAQKAADALNTFTSSRTMTTPEQVEQRRTEINDEIAGLMVDIREAESDMRVEIGRYEVANRLADLGCLQPRPGPLCTDAVLMNYDIARRDAKYRFFDRYQELAKQTVALAAERHTLETYRMPLAAGNCDALKQQPPAPVSPSALQQACRAKGWKLVVEKGLIHVAKKKYPWAEFVVEPVVYGVNDWILKPDGTEFIIEKQGDLAYIRVLDGSVELTGPDGRSLTVEAGFQTTLPDGEITELEPLPLRLVGGIPLNELQLDSNVPQPYGVIELGEADGALPPDWVWQEPDKDLTGPGDATLEFVDPETLRITVPNENEFWNYRSDAPRLLHKVTGDFDLEAEMQMESEATDFAYSEFLLFTPDTPLGYLEGQMNADGIGAHYYIAGGGWNLSQGANFLSIVNRDQTYAANAPDGPARVKLSRRGDVLKTYWSTDDGQTWTLSNRQTLTLPETVWAGWVFKRMALDGLNDVPAVTTLRNIRLTTAPLDSMLADEWDVIGYTGTAIALGADLYLFQDGTAKSYSQVYSPWSLDGNFDLIVRYEAPALEPQPGQERYINIAVTTNDEKNHAYVSNALTADWQRMVADMAINESWYRYFDQDTEESTGRVRLVRQEGIVSAYLWQDGDWTLLTDWRDAFSEPVYLDFRFQWISPEPSPQTAHFTIERLETDEGLLFDVIEIAPTEAAQGTQSSEPTSTQDAAPETPTRVRPLESKPNVQRRATPEPSPAPTTEPTSEPILQPTPTPLLVPTPAHESAPTLTGEQRLQADTVFDDFSSTALGWSVRDSDASTTSYEQGGYALLVKQPTYWVMSKTAGDFAPSVMEFDASVMPDSSGGMFGVICHYRNAENYDFMTIDPETLSISVARYIGDEFVYVSKGPDGVAELPSSGLANAVTAVNHIRAVCLEDRLELTVNGILEGTWSLEPPADGGNAALFVYGFRTLGEEGYKTLFDNFAAWRDAPAP